MIDQEEIHNQCLSNDPKERSKALNKLRENFPSLPDKQQAWNDLHKLTADKYWDVKYYAASALDFVSAHVPDKQQAWNDLINLTNDKDWDVKSKAFYALGSIYPDMPDKQRAWSDLHKLTADNDWNVRYRATSTLGSVFSNIPDKKQAWNDLIKLTTDKDSVVRYKASSALGSAFSDVLDKQQAWNDLHKLTADEYSDVRYRVASALGSIFSDVPDKQQLWNDLIKLTTDKDNAVRCRAVSALGSVFSDVPDKEQVWNDLIKLTTNKDSIVKHVVFSALGSVFFGVLDKQQAWNDLHKLTTDEYSDVRYYAAFVIGSVFYDIPDKQQVRDDLIKLTTDEDSKVKIFANHSLGKVSIFRASQAEREEDYKKELENAIIFFEKAAQQSPYWLNPSQFCLPFYRSFHTIIFKRQDSKKEVNKYLAKAKAAVRSSKSKKLLFEAVNNLSNALKEIQNLENLEFEAKKRELNLYRKYCDRAAELIGNTEEAAPFATIAMRKGLPILDRKLNALLDEIQQKAKNACKDSKGTDAEEIACAVSREVQRWEISNQEEMNRYVPNLVMVLKSKIPYKPENKEILDLIESMKYERDLAKQYNVLPTIIAMIPTVNMVPEKIVTEGFENLQMGISKIEEKLEEMTVSLKPGPKGELVISKGLNIAGSGAQIVATIPLAEINYPELTKDLEEIKGKLPIVPELPSKLFNKIRGYLP